VGFFDGLPVVMTGATGFVGGRLARELVARGARVTAIHRDDGIGTRRLEEAAASVRFVEADLLDPVAVRDLLDETRPAVIYHMATYYAVDNDVDLGAMIDTNVKAGALLVSACRDRADLRLLVNVGTCAEFGDFRGLADETTRIDPNNAYASTKAAQTVVMRQLGRDLGVPLTTLRLYNMYGEWEKPERLVPYVILSLMRGERVELTAGEQAKDYSYLGDVVDAFLATAEKHGAAAGETLNIGSGVTVTMRGLVEEIAKHFPGSDGLVDFGAKPYRPDEMWFQGTSIAAARRVLGWEPRTSLADGIASVVGWYRDHAAEYGVA